MALYEYLDCEINSTKERICLFVTFYCRLSESGSIFKYIFPYKMSAIILFSGDELQNGITNATATYAPCTWLESEPPSSITPKDQSRTYDPSIPLKPGSVHLA